MATLTSQNGWRVLPIPPPRVQIPDTDIWLSLCPGDPAFLLTRVASFFHKSIERLDMPVKEKPGVDDWGYAKRNVRGSTTQISNHSSGTAEDLNATQHPRGVKGTFSAEEKNKIHAHLREYKDPVTGRQVIRWGEDYSGTIDGMHFEINGDEDEVRRVAAKLRALDAKREEEEMPTAKEVAAETVKLLLNTPISEMEYVRRQLNDVDGKFTLAEALNHAVGQGAGALGGTVEANRELDEMRAKVESLDTKLDAVIKLLTPEPEPDAPEGTNG